MSAQEIRQFKVCLIGEGGVGKTTFVNRILNKKFNPRYRPTLGVEVHPVVFKTRDEYIQFNVWDCAGQEKLMGLRDGYFINSDCAMIFFDPSENGWVSLVREHIRSFRRVRENAPVILVMTKSDVRGSNRIRNNGLVEMAISISAKKDRIEKLVKPFESFARQANVLGDDESFINENVSPPKEHSSDNTLINELENVASQ